MFYNNGASSSHQSLSPNLGSVTTSPHCLGFILIFPLEQVIVNHQRYRSCQQEAGCYQNLKIENEK